MHICFQEKCTEGCYVNSAKTNDDGRTLKLVCFQLKMMSYLESHPLFHPLSPLLSAPIPSFLGICKVMKSGYEILKLSYFLCKIFIPSYMFDVLLSRNWPFLPPDCLTLQITLLSVRESVKKMPFKNRSPGCLLLIQLSHSP